MDMEINITESLIGFKKTIKTLDKRVLLIESAPGKVVPHNALRAITGEGMPQHRNPFNKGELLIKFTVVFPPQNYLPERKLKLLEKSLPKRVDVMHSGIAEEVELVDYDESRRRQRQHRHPHFHGYPPGFRGYPGFHSAHYDDSEDDEMDGMHGHGPSCSQQ
ncbi:DNAJA4 [Bugula neritina]|uniref:DNAJA4 n=1 Tax=Bugula neritina TaxID=10212 RepID=A0A7J7JL53_BUGNE|nr:DNAJA4 [Bugula neritina]